MAIDEFITTGPEGEGDSDDSRSDSVLIVNDAVDETLEADPVLTAQVTAALNQFHQGCTEIIQSNS